MNGSGLWHDWVHRPQSLRARRALFQVHLWVALLVGVYVVVMSVTGSAVVFRPDVSRWLVPRAVPSAEGSRLVAEALDAAIRETYLEYEVVRVTESFRPNGPVSVLLASNGQEHGRLFDPYAVADMGESFPMPVRVIEWLTDLHDNLLADTTGRKINGVGGVLMLVLCVTGLVIWWPGKHRWTRSAVLLGSTPRGRFLWHLHSVIGIWTLAFLFIWGLTAFYFAFPAPFEAIIDSLDRDPEDFERPGEGVLLALIDLHFGRFGGLWGRTAWAILGLLPAALFVTGFTIWWRRVVRPRWRAALPPSAA
jgi:uncharacterized iron-regulated membrane protein